MLCLTISAITLHAALAGCASSTPKREPLSRDIGPPPPYLRPVSVPPSYEGLNAAADAKRLTGLLREANSIIVCARNEWVLTRDRMMGVEGKAAPRCAQAK